MQPAGADPMQPGEGTACPGSPAPALDRKVQGLEVCVFLSLILPAMVMSFFVVRRGNPPFELVAASAILRDLPLLALIAFFLWRNGEPVGRVGWQRGGGWREAVLGVVLYGPFFLGVSLLGATLRATGLSSPSTTLPSFLTPKGPTQFLMALALVTVAAVAEETIFRGYLILRLRAAIRSPTAAVLLSSLVFASGHAYEGAAGVVVVFAMGTAFALIYLWRESLIAPMVMHFLQDFIGIILLPLFGPR